MAARKIFVQMAAYIYLDVPDNVLKALLNCPAYEYKYGDRLPFHYYPEKGRIELRVVEEDDIAPTPYEETEND